MELNKGQPGMGGNVVQATSRNPRVGSRAMGVMANLLGAQQRKEQMDYQHSLNVDRDVTREAAKAAGHIVKGRTDNMLQQENIQFHLNIPEEQRQNLPKSMRTGSTSYDYGSDYVEGLKQLQAQKAKDEADLLKQRQDAVTEKKNKNTPGGKGGKKKNKVGEPKERPGTLKDTQAALKAGHIDEEQAANISPTFARNLGRKAAAEKVKNPANPVKPKKAKQTPDNIKKVQDGIKNLSDTIKADSDRLDNAYNADQRLKANTTAAFNKTKKTGGAKPPKSPKPPKVGM